MANAAYWFDGQTGNFITSTHYRTDLPKWANEFNEKQWPKKYLEKDWKPLRSAKDYALHSLPDESTYEGSFPNEAKPVFPHNVLKYAESQNDWDIIRDTPMGNTLTTEFAMAAIKGEDLGDDDITDFIAISYSSTDYVGHQFGIRSMEIADTYLRLDENLADLLTFLDKRVGDGNYLLFSPPTMPLPKCLTLCWIKKLPPVCFALSRLWPN